MPAYEGKKYIGKMKKFNESKGWGFIECNDVRTDYNHCNDVYLHLQQWSDAGKPEEGTRVRFEVEEKKGRPQARHVEMRRGLDIEKINELSKMVCSPNLFLQTRTLKIAGREVDVKLLPTSLAMELHRDHSPGKLVAEMEKLQVDFRDAELIHLLQHSDSKFQGDLSTDAGESSKGSSPRSEANSDECRRFQGWYYRFDLDSGYGFIFNEELKRKYGWNVFLHKRQFEEAGLWEPCHVEFGVHFQKNRPQARDVRIIDTLPDARNSIVQNMQLTGENTNSSNGIVGTSPDTTTSNAQNALWSDEQMNIGNKIGPKISALLAKAGQNPTYAKKITGMILENEEALQELQSGAPLEKMVEVALACLHENLQP
jgi:cold shock CspA family protein